ncbi:MAG: dephospho-CoA kinase, partial [Xanthomonadales bacterium]|nr:dephospho-CoA kinase [Xanthomonadales bacterium]
MSVIVALTGGIASGKTLASSCMAKAGIAIIDADVVARSVVAKGSETLLTLVKKFGRQILTADGSLDRATLKKNVFNDPVKLNLLNQITHPRIQSEIKTQLAHIKSDFVVLVIPLLNIHMLKIYEINRVLVVDVDSDVQRQRVMVRDQIDMKMANKVMASQIDRKERLIL